MNERWEVLTPEYGTLIPITDDGMGPMEYGRDWALVTAPTAREAVSIAVRAWLRGENPDEDSPGPLYGRTYCQRQREDGLSPWTGIRATAWVEPPAEDVA